MPGNKPQPFPALREFLRGYFHQDLADEYGSPEGATKQFLRDADAEQRAAVKHEWSMLLRQTSHQSLDHMNEALRKLGSVWTFESLVELHKIGEILGKASD